MEEEEKKNLADCIRNLSSSKLAHRIFFYKDLVILQMIEIEIERKNFETIIIRLNLWYVRTCNYFV